MSIISKQVVHNFDFATISMSATRLAKSQKAAMKLLDKKFAVKAEFLSGVYDDEVILRGAANNVSEAISFIKTV